MVIMWYVVCHTTVLAHHDFLRIVVILRRDEYLVSAETSLSLLSFSRFVSRGPPLSFLTIKGSCSYTVTFKYGRYSTEYDSMWWYSR